MANHASAPASVAGVRMGIVLDPGIGGGVRNSTSWRAMGRKSLEATKVRFMLMGAGRGDLLARDANGCRRWSSSASADLCVLATT